ncbi:MAG TPA: energy transducer TonB [Myxococcales bacterium]|nr:energy transducer TonB [Myxococcales bacterium]
MSRERGWAFLIALALHAAVVALAMQVGPRPSPPVRPLEPQAPLHRWKAAPGKSPATGRHGVPHPVAPSLVAEREIIDQGNGVTLSIEGGPWLQPAADEPEASPHAAERWLRAEIFVPTAPDTAPRPSDYCRPLEMPEFAADREITGRVEVEYTVDSWGIASDVVQARDAPLVLSNAVRAWLAGCAFEPATDQGRPVPARVRQAFVFKIK